MNLTDYLDRVTQLSIFRGKEKTLHIGTRSAPQFARVPITLNTNRKLGRESMGIVGTLELPTRISPCLRLFIEMLFDELDFNRAASWDQNHGVQSAITIQAEEALEPVKSYLEGLRR